MSFEKAKADLEEKGLGDHVIVLSESSATVAEAAHALGVEPASIAKTLSVLQGEKPVLSFNSALILLGALGILPPATSAMLHNLSTLGISLRSMTDLLEQEVFPLPSNGTLAERPQMFCGVSK